MNSSILSCDWGTSRLRLKLVDLDSQQVVASVENEEGVKKTFFRWSEKKTEDRQSHFLRVLKDALTELSRVTGRDLDSTTLLMSGMASSSIGLKELPYASLPISLMAENIIIEKLHRNPLVSQDIFLISGVQKPGDVIRGEETQVLGWASLRSIIPSQVSLILAGTHSKHIFIRDSHIVDFKTYMTGELFELLIRYSILRDSLKSGSTPQNHGVESFTRGVVDIQQGNLSHLLFSLRANNLQGILNAEEATHYLSGLLVGQELKDGISSPIILCCSSRLKSLYKKAIEICIPKGTESLMEVVDDEHLTVTGHLHIYNQLIRTSFL